METVIIAIVLIAGGIAYAAYMFNKSGKAVLEIQYMQTTPIVDAMELIDSMTESDPNYHHYVELKGVLQSEEPVEAPFTERRVAYYKNRCYSVNEETRTERDSNGNTRTRVVKTENEISNENSSTPVFLTDSSCDTRVYIDLPSFGSDADYQSGCDRFEPENSVWLQRNYSRYQWSHSGARFLGYRLKEEVLNANQPVYVLGEMYRNGDRLYIGKSVVAKKPSKFSYKSEDQLVNDTKNKKIMSLVLGGGAVLIGIILLITYFVG